MKRLPLAWLAGMSLFVLSSLAYGANQTIEPSPALLKLAGVSAYKISEDIRIKVTRDDIKSPLGRSVCDLSPYVPLFFTSKIADITTIKVAIESPSFERQSLLFSIYNHGGLSRPYLSGTILVNLDQYHKYLVKNIWVFYFTDKEIYANFIQAQCVGY